MARTTDGKAATLRDVAERAGASPAAVSVALNRGVKTTIRVSPATRERIEAAAAELGYVSNPIARSLATGRTGVIGLMLPQPSSFTEHDPFLTLLMNGVLEEAVRHRYNVMLYTATGGREGGVVDSRVDGVVLVIPPRNGSIFEECLAKGIAVVSVLRRPKDAEEWTVNSDDAEGGRLATQRLIDLGHRRIAHVMGNPGVETTAARRRAFVETLAGNGLGHDPRRLAPGGFSVAEGKAAGAALLALPEGVRPTAVFCANDLCAHGVLLATTESGLRTPDDLAVVGYDDSWFATMTQPPLTTVNMAIEAMGARAASLLVAQIEGRPVLDRQPVMPVSLTIRQSCGAHAASQTSYDAFSMEKTQ